MRFFLKNAAIFFLAATISANCAAEDAEYQLGLGKQLSKNITLGGYFSLEYKYGETVNEFAVDDLALLLYGSLTDNFSYMLELEAVDLYKADYITDEKETNPIPVIERLYGDYKFSDALAIRFGKLITPIGYWNLQPINVLRETTSNPRLSRDMFPKFLTGIDNYGYASQKSNVIYHVYLQATSDLDNERINIDADSHYGASIEKQLSQHWQAGGSLGQFTEPTDDSRTQYIQLNSRLDTSQYSLSFEAMFSEHKTGNSASHQPRAMYTQGVYWFTPKHAAVSRVEYYRNDQTSVREWIGLLGYSYRPVYPVSLKAEYQWHTNPENNRFLSSFSVLF